MGVSNLIIKRTHTMKTAKLIKIFLMIFGSVGCLSLSFFLGIKYSPKVTEVPQPTLPQPIPDVVQNSDTRVESREDGTHVLWIKSNSGTLITEYHFAASGSLSYQFIHRIDAQGLILSSRIYDGQKVEIFKTRYGYTREDHVLVEEQIFDSRTKHMDANNQEKPVLRVVHVKDPSTGKKSRHCIQLVIMDLPAELKSGFRNPFILTGDN